MAGGARASGHGCLRDKLQKRQEIHEKGGAGSMDRKAYPGYEYHLNLYDILANGTPEEKEKANAAQQSYIKGYTLPELSLIHI